MARLLEDLCWPDVEEYLRGDDRLVLVIGSTEQHGRHLAFGSDAWVPWEIACRLSERSGVLLAPAVSYGMSLHHLGFPGSLSLRPSTLSTVVQDLLESAYGHGFRRILLLNGHGGNTAAIQSALAETLHDLPDLEVHAGQWWLEPVVKAIFEAHLDGVPAHADAAETSVVLAVRPGAVRLERAQHSPGAPKPRFLTRWVFQEHYPHGVIGSDPRAARVEIGEQAVAAAVEVYAAVLEAWRPQLGCPVPIPEPDVKTR